VLCAFAARKEGTLRTSIEWTVGVVVAVLAIMFVLPGIASAADPGPVVDASTACDGTFSIAASYVNGQGTQREYVWINGHSWDDSFGNNGGTPPSGMSVSQDSAHYVANNGAADYYKYAGDTTQDDFFVLSGDYQSVQDYGDVTVEVDQTNDVDYVPPFKSGAIVTASDSGAVGSTDWEKCRISYCQAGDSNGGSDLSFLATPENNCDPVRLCLDNGQSATVTEYDAEGLLAEGATKGSCTPSEPPPPAITTSSTEPTPKPPVEQEPISEVSPAVEEVVALPAAGYGVTASGFAWTALAAATLSGLGTATLLAARRRS
jgi:hypothetical protein